MTGVLKEIVVPAKNLWKGTLIFLHGSGDNAPSFKYAIDSIYGSEFSFSNVKVIYPTAPLQPYDLYDGELSNVWFNRSSLSLKAKEIKESIDQTAEKIKHIILEEGYQGINPSNIVLGGFSMGGCMSLHMAYRHQRDVKGVFVASSFLSDGSSVYEALDANGTESAAPLLMFHGRTDNVVPFQWGRSTYQKLSSIITESSFLEFPKLEHSLNREGLMQVKDFVTSKLES